MSGIDYGKLNSEQASDFWSSSDKLESAKDMAHWRGEGRWNENKWLSVGEESYALFEELCRIVNVDPKTLKSMIEWGPGGGSNLYKFSDSFDNIFGVDISKASLEECRLQLEHKGFGEFKSILIEDNPDIVLDTVDGKLDFFLSVAVFQHFISKSYGLRVLDIASELLKPGGLAIVQIRYCGSQNEYPDLEKNYKDNLVYFTTYDIDEFWQECVLGGFEPISVKLDPKTNYAFYFLRRTKKRSFLRKKHNLNILK